MTYLRKPEWLKTQLKSDLKFEMVSRIVKEHNLHTICSSGRCPNMCECWNKGTATFMILGDICTRGCRFCNTATGRPLSPDPAEPAQLAESIRLMGLRHAVITAVTRDDLPDQGAAHWAASIRAVKQANPHTTLEVLIPDFDARPEWLDRVMAEYPEIISHNLETVRRLTPQVRTKARYDTSLDVLRYLSAHGVTTKTGIMLGLGETEDEVLALMDDALAAGCSILTIGQYMQPSRRNIPVAAYIHPDQFAEYKRIGLAKGFRVVESAPLVRSSYCAERHVAPPVS